jgi:hypothetical protein
MLVVAEGNFALLNPAGLFDEDPLGAIDHDVGDTLLFEQDFEGPEAERFIEHFFDQALALAAVEQWVFGIAEMFDDQADFPAERIAFEVAQTRQVELFDELAVDQPLEAFKVLFGSRCAATATSGDRGWGRHVGLLVSE